MITLIAFTMSTGTVYVTRSTTASHALLFVTIVAKLVSLPGYGKNRASALSGSGASILVTECDLSAPSRRSLRVCTTIRPPESFLLAWSQRVVRKC